MTMSDDQLDVLLRRADPLAEAPHRSPAETEAALLRLTAIGPGEGRGPRSSRRQRRHLLLGLAPVGVAGAAAVALILSATSSTPPAYALTSHADGSITITLNDLTTGIPALNARLKQLGINETVLPVTQNCPYATPVLSGPGPGADLSDTITIGPKDISEPAGVDAYLAAEQLPDGSIGLGIGGMKAPLPSCISPTLMKVEPSNTPSPAPAGPQDPGTPRHPRPQRPGQHPVYEQIASPPDKGGGLGNQVLSPIDTLEMGKRQHLRALPGGKSPVKATGSAEIQ